MSQTSDTLKSYTFRSPLCHNHTLLCNPIFHHLPPLPPPASHAGFMATPNTPVSCLPQTLPLAFPSARKVLLTEFPRLIYFLICIVKYNPDTEKYIKTHMYSWMNDYKTKSPLHYPGQEIKRHQHFNHSTPPPPPPPKCPPMATIPFSPPQRPTLSLWPLFLSFFFFLDHYIFAFLYTVSI